MAFWQHTFDSLPQDGVGGTGAGGPEPSHAAAGKADVEQPAVSLEIVSMIRENAVAENEKSL